MNTFQITYIPDPLDSLRDYSAMQRRLFPFWDRFFVLLTLFFTISYIPLSLFFSFPLGDYLHIPHVILFIVFAFTGRFVSEKGLWPYSRRRLIKRTKEADPPHQTTLSADANGIVASDGHRTVELRWSVIRDVAQFRHGVWVVACGFSIHIPNSAFADAAQRASLIALAKDYLEPRQAQSQA